MKMIKPITNDEKYLSSRGNQQGHILFNLQKIKEWNEPISAILTCKYNLTENQLRKKYSNYICRMSKSVFPNSFKRHNLLLKEISYIEYGKLNSQIHSHMIIEKPHKIPTTDFKKMLRDKWGSIGSVISIISIVDGDSFLADYNTKYNTKMTAEGGFTVQDSRLSVSKFSTDNKPRRGANVDIEHHSVSSNFQQITDASRFITKDFYRHKNQRKKHI